MHKKCNFAANKRKSFVTERLVNQQTRRHGVHSLQVGVVWLFDKPQDLGIQNATCQSEKR